MIPANCALKRKQMKLMSILFLLFLLVNWVYSCREIVD